MKSKDLAEEIEMLMKDVGEIESRNGVLEYNLHVMMG